MRTLRERDMVVLGRWGGFWIVGRLASFWRGTSEGRKVVGSHFGGMLDFFLRGGRCVLRGLTGDWYAMSVRRTSKRLWSCVWDVK